MRDDTWLARRKRRLPNHGARRLAALKFGPGYRCSECRQHGSQPVHHAKSNY
jgi:hypothetical protein